MIKMASLGPDCLLVITDPYSSMIDYREPLKRSVGFLVLPNWLKIRRCQEVVAQIKGNCVGIYSIVNLPGANNTNAVDARLKLVGTSSKSYLNLEQKLFHHLRLFGMSRSHHLSEEYEVCLFQG